MSQSFLRLDLVDEIRLSTVPVLLGDGVQLLGHSGTETRWRFKDVVAYKTAFVEFLYGRDSSNC
jgi:dihydrofolate reductase